MRPQQNQGDNANMLIFYKISVSIPHLFYTDSFELCIFSSVQWIIYCLHHTVQKFQELPCIHRSSRSNKSETGHFKYIGCKVHATAFLQYFLTFL